MESEAAALRQRTMVSGLAALVARTAQGALSLGAAVILARLLTPADFGVFAMVLPLGALATNMTNQCLQTAILQSRELRGEELDGFFRFATVVALLVGAAMAVSGLGLAWFYDEPRVVGVAAVWGCVIAVLPLPSFQEALLKRDLRFPRVLGVQLATLILGIGSSVLAAWLGAGYWALPLQIFVMEAAHVIGIAWLSPWRPRLRSTPGGPGSVGLRRAWVSLVGVRFAGWLNEQPDLAAIGRVSGSFVLGTYDTARRWAWYPFEEPYLALTDVNVARLARERDDPARFRHLVIRSILVMLTVSLPAIAFVGVEAASVVRVLLGNQWASAVPFLRLMCIVAFAGAVIRTSQWVVLAHGRNGRLLRWSLLFQLPATGLAVAAGLSWGPMGVARALAMAQVVLVLPAVAYAVRGTSVAFVDVLHAAARPALSGLCAALALALLGSHLPGEPGAPRLLAALGTFAVSFIVVWLGTPGGVRDTAALVNAFRSLRFLERSGGGAAR